MAQVTIESLKKIELFATLTDEELTQVRDRMTVKNFKRNETILFEEDTGEFMYIILTGKVKAVKTTEEGKEIILAMHQADDFFGEMSLIDGKTTPASVIATDHSTIAIISKKDFYSMLDSQGKVLRNLLTIFSSRLRKSWATIELLNFNNAAERIKMLFLMLADDYGSKTPDGMTLNIKLTHQDISDMTGMARETVTRVLDRLQKKGDITIIDKSHVHLKFPSRE